MWLKARHRQLLVNPSAPCPGRRHKNKGRAKVPCGYKSLAREALNRLPGKRGTVTEICAEILNMDSVIQHLDRELEFAPSRSAGREIWMNLIADELSHRRDFLK